MLVIYRNCPLIEVACALTFEPDTAWDLTLPGRLFDKIQDRFPTRRQIAGLQISAQESGEPKPSPIEVLQFLSADKAEVVQLADHTLAISRLAPYQGWEMFRPTLVGVFSDFRFLAPSLRITRVGLKYINKIMVPRESFMMEDYFAVYPYISEKLPQELGTFFMGVEFSPDELVKLRMELTTGTPDKPGEGTVFLSLDCFTSRTGAVTFDTVEAWLASAHNHQRTFFEGAITDKTRELLGVIHVGL